MRCRGAFYARRLALETQPPSEVVSIPHSIDFNLQSASPAVMSDYQSRLAFVQRTLSIEREHHTSRNEHSSHVALLSPPKKKRWRKRRTWVEFDTMAQWLWGRGGKSTGHRQALIFHHASATCNFSTSHSTRLLLIIIKSSTRRESQGSHQQTLMTIFRLFALCLASLLHNILWNFLISYQARNFSSDEILISSNELTCLPDCVLKEAKN